MPGAASRSGRIVSVSAERGGRYERSFGGLIGAMILTVVVIIGYVVFRAVVRDDFEVERDTVDHEMVVRGYQESGDDSVTYPRALPAGWRAVAAGPSAANGWLLDVLTEDDEWSVGLRQEDRSVPDMLRVYIDEDGQAEADGTVALTGDLGGEWQVYRDSSDGDYALVRDLGERNIIVYSRAPEEQVRAYVESLTQEPLPKESATPQPR